MKNAIELGISDAERAALIDVRDYLRGPGADTFEPEESWENDTTPFEEARLMFNMSETCSGYECGTVACIGGSMSLVLEGVRLRPTLIVSSIQQALANAYVRGHYIGGNLVGAEPFLHDHRMKPIYDAAPGLAKLFYPRPIVDWDAIRPDVAAEAIDRFLNTGDPDWVEIARERGIPLEEAFR